MNSVTPQIFATRLEETIFWCKPRIDEGNPRWCLRSETLRPEQEFDDEADPTFWNKATTVENVLQKRASLVNIEAERYPIDLCGGRLLLCFYQYTNHNYLTDHVTDGYFDGYDNPPWDTWVFAVEDVLISWVPPIFFHRVEEALRVEAVGMLMWLDNPLAHKPEGKGGMQPLPAWLSAYHTCPGKEITGTEN